ncbi:hypothetical protein BGW41_007249 [Actinomortierella wolfii]|nr:hypothetical protein BGW41_007249 [Actinomortierella wolfii]
MMETALLRSYVKRSILPLTNLSGILQKNRNNITIKLAATATSAAPTFFPEVYWKPYGFNHILIFWDGGLLNNNPIVPLWFERHDVVGPNAPEPAISCVISIGTGHKNPSTRRSILCKLVGIASSVMSFATSTSSEDKNFESHMTDLNGRPEHENTKYIRFNPPLEHEIALSDYHRIDELVDLTTKYLQEVSVQKKLEEAVEAICPSKRDSLLSP